MKKLLKGLLALVIILLALVLLHPVWIGPVVRTAVSVLVPRFLGVPAKLDGFAFNAYTGRVTIDGFALDNPPGCPQPKFVTVGHLCVGVNPTTLVSDAIVVEEITLDDLYVSIVADTQRVYNFDTVARNCASDEKKADAAQPEPKPSAPQAPGKKTEDKSSGPKVILDLVQVRNALVLWERVPLPLPSFRMTGLGRQSGGVTLDVAWKEVETRFIGELGPLGQGLITALEQGQGAAEVTKSVDATQKAVTDVQNAFKDGSQESVDKAVRSVKEASKSVEDGVKTLKALFGK